MFPYPLKLSNNLRHEGFICLGDRRDGIIVPPGGVRMEPLKILIVASEAPPVVSGVARSVGEIADGLARRGHQVSVWSSADSPGLRWDRLRVSSLGLTLRKRLRQNGPFDIVNIHGPAPTISDLALLTLALSRKHPPIVYTHHFAMHFGIPGIDQVGSLYDSVLKFISTRSAVVVTTSRSYANAYSSAQKPAVVIPWGLSPADTIDTPKNDYDGRRPLRVLVVGQFRRYKGMAIAVRAALESPKIHLTLVGDGPTFESVKTIVPSTSENIALLGKVGDSALRNLYESNDVILLPSRTRMEAFGIVLLEGMRHGCVPVASDLPGVREVVGENGLLARPGDSKDLREVLLRLANDPLLVNSLSDKSRVAAQAFTWQRTVDGYESLFHRITGDALREADV